MPGKVRRWEDMFSKTQILKTADYFGVFTIYSAFFVWLLILSILSILLPNSRETRNSEG